MKHLKLFIAFVVILSAMFMSCAKNGKSNDSDKKVLVVYFSATGTTQKVAEQIAKTSGADIMAIEMEEPYTEADFDGSNEQSRCSIEKANPDARPAIKKPSVNIADYDTIILGYPIWWDGCPRVINTFIESNNLKGKAVKPFATSGGSGIENSVTELKKLYPDINWTEGHLFNEVTDGAINTWLSE